MSTIDEQDPSAYADDIQQEYRYAAGWGRLLFGPPLLTCFCAACVYAALFMERGVRLWGLIHLPPPVVKVLCGLGAVGLGIAAIAGFRDLFRRLTTRPRLALTRTGLIVPTSRGQEKLIPFEAMSRIQPMRAQDTENLVAVQVDSAAGSFTIQQALLPTGALDEIVETLTREFERHHRPDLIRHREQFWEEERRREESYEASGGNRRRAAPPRTKKHQILALPFGEVEPKIVAAFDTADKADEYVKFLRGSEEYQWVRIEERQAADE
jgi:hypothetical protein